MGIRTLIVDDEMLARERLRLLLAEQEDIEVIGEAESGIEAVEKIEALRPELVFLDIEMPGLNGFKVVQSLGRQHLPNIIFVTAYNQYAIEAFEVGAIDYLLKPVKKSRVLEALGRARKSARRPGRDLAVARRVQNRLLPDRDLRLGSVEAAGICLAVDGVGGDYYDLIELAPDRLAICIADISGKGFAAALMMANLQAALRILVKGSREPAALLGELSRLFYQNSVPEMYATMFYGTYDGTSRSLTYCNAGHNPPLLFRAGEMEKLECGGTVIGMFADAKYEQAAVQLGPGDTIVAYSDGLAELTDESGRELGEGLLIRLLRDNPSRSAVEIKKLLLDKIGVLIDNGTQRDDITVVIIKVVA